MPSVNTPSKSQPLPLPLNPGEWEAKPSKPQAKGDRTTKNPIWPKLHSSVVENEEPRETLRLVKVDGQAVTLHYSDILYTKFLGKERIVLQMRNDDDFNIVGRNLHLILYDLENRRLFILAECQPGECGPDEPTITSISGVVFEDMPKPVPPQTARGLVKHKSEIKF